LSGVDRVFFHNAIVRGILYLVLGLALAAYALRPRRKRRGRYHSAPPDDRLWRLLVFFTGLLLIAGGVTLLIRDHGKSSPMEP